MGDRAIAHAPITVNHSGIPAPVGSDLAFSLAYHATTDGNGRFVFDRVLPGKGWVGRHVSWPEDGLKTAVSSTFGEETTFRAGETIQIGIREKGRRVVGRLLAAAAAGRAVQTGGRLGIRNCLARARHQRRQAADPMDHSRGTRWFLSVRRRAGRPLLAGRPVSRPASAQPMGAHRPRSNAGRQPQRRSARLGSARA